MKCHYEILGVPLDVEHDELKKSYRKLALKWHPDKNPNNQAQAKEQFQLIQQAYDILNDPQERSWYDRHRDAILRGGLGGDYKDTSIDVFPYFTTTCFKGYTDEPQGFYSVYREVFNKIAVEDLEFSDDPEIQVPGFGTLESDYETVVHSFYAHWSAYLTKKTYSWLEPYDARDTPNRRVLRLVEKENKKIRDKARRERNEAVRSLVAFVRKRDRRVHAWARELERRSAANALRVQQRREQAVRERRAQTNAEPSWAQFASVEHELRAIESKLAQDDPGTDDDGDDDEAFYCAACNKVFKTCKAFGNHEQSKKHREGVAALRASLIADDAEVEEDDNDEDDELDDEESGDEHDVGASEDEQNVEQTVEENAVEVKKPEEDDESHAAEQAVTVGSQSESEDLTEQLLPPKSNGRIEPTLPANSDEDDSAPETKRKQRRKAELKDSSDDEAPAPRKLKGKKAKDARKRARELAADPAPTLGSGRDKKADGVASSKGKPGKVKVVASAEKQPEGVEDALEELTVNGVKEEEDEAKGEEGVAGDAKERVNGASDTDKTSETVQVEVRQVDPPLIESGASAVGKDAASDESNKKSGPRANNVEEAASRRGGRSKKDLAHACASCHRGFPSKNKLFEHLKATGHAVAVAEAAPPPPREKRAGRRNRAN